jgi:hypothetical protein
MGDALPLVSIIIPVHNRPDLLRRALRSVRAQTVEDWEAIMVDDASDPPVPAPADPRIRTLRLERNAGPAAARNAGLAAARGAYAAFLDSDDEWLPQKLAAQLASIRPGRVLVSGVALVGGPAPLTLPTRAKKPAERIATYLYVANQFAQASGFFAPTALARAVGFDPDLRQYEDHLFLIRAEAAGAEIEVATTPLTRHHVDPRADRLGRRDDPARAAAFLRAADLLPHERAAFQLRCTAPGAPPRDAIRMALAAMRTRGAPKDAALKLLARKLLGPTAYAALRAARARGVTRWSTKPTA